MAAVREEALTLTVTLTLILTQTIIASSPHEGAIGKRGVAHHYDHHQQPIRGRGRWGCWDSGGCGGAVTDPRGPGGGREQLSELEGQPGQPGLLRSLGVLPRQPQRESAVPARLDLWREWQQQAHLTQAQQTQVGRWLGGWVAGEVC